MPENPYENLTAVASLRTEAAQKGRYGQFAGSVDTSQAKCKLGLRPIVYIWLEMCKLFVGVFVDVFRIGLLVVS